MNEYILHLDMDGVLSDFDAGFKKISNGLTPEEYRAKNGRNSEASLFLQDGRGFFEGLEWQEGGPELVKFACAHFKVIRILSSAGTGADWTRFKEVQTGKLAWLATHIPQIQKKNIIIVPFANIKARHAGPDRILIDDKDTTINRWIENSGVGILHDYRNWKNSIEQLQSYSTIPVKLSEIVETL